MVSSSSSNRTKSLTRNNHQFLILTAAGMNWLYPPIVCAFKEINERTIKTNGHGVDAFLINNATNKRCGTTQVRLYSIELWDLSGNLVAGELGHSVGSIYTSLTGFSKQDNAGSVQLLALGKLLLQCGFEYWDLGMEMDYKNRLGAELMRRPDFVKQIQRTRVEHSNTVLRCDRKHNARELIDWDRESVFRNKFVCDTSSRTSSTVTETSKQDDIANGATEPCHKKHCKKRAHDENEAEYTSNMSPRQS